MSYKDGVKEITHENVSNAVVVMAVIMKCVAQEFMTDVNNISGLLSELANRIDNCMKDAIGLNALGTLDFESKYAITGWFCQRCYWSSSSSAWTPDKSVVDAVLRIFEEKGYSANTLEIDPLTYLKSIEDDKCFKVIIGSFLMTLKAHSVIRTQDFRVIDILHNELV